MKKFCCKTRGFRSGFSLLEVLFTVVILAVLAAVAVPLYSNTKTTAALNACKNNIQTLATAESKYKFENGGYTTTASNLISYGIAAVPVCPLDGSAYTLTLNAGNTLTVTCSGATHGANTITLN